MSDDAAEFAKKLGGPMKYDLYPFNLGYEATYTCYNSLATQTATGDALKAHNAALYPQPGDFVTVTWTPVPGSVTYHVAQRVGDKWVDVNANQAYCWTGADWFTIGSDEPGAPKPSELTEEDTLGSLVVSTEERGSWVYCTHVDGHVSAYNTAEPPPPIDYFAITRDVSA